MRSLLSWLATSLVVSSLACGGDDSASPPSAQDGGFDANDASSASPDASTMGDAGSPISTTFTPAAIPLSDPELSNPLRGQYLWIGNPPYPAGWPDVDSYQRWNWAQLEPSRGNYQWKLIDDEIAAATARHGRFGMRLMALCQGCNDHVYKNAKTSIPDDLADVVNPLIASAPGTSDPYLIPDWNSDAYFTRLGEVLNAIAARYHDDPHFAWVDVSSYGNWGEMHLWPFSAPGGPYDTSSQRPITDANAARLVQLNAQAFSNKLLVVNSEQQAALKAAVASVSPPIGLRVDCLGSDGLAGGADALNAVAGAADRWKTAPFLTEWCQKNLGSSGANLFVQGEAQVRQYHVSMLSSDNFASNPSTSTETAAFRQANVESGYRLRVSQAMVGIDQATRSKLRVSSSWVNDNVAPTYLAWKVVVGLRAKGAPATIEASLALDLRKCLPGAPLADDETLPLPSSIPPGTYDVYVRVDDAQKVALPMQLAMQGREASGAYVLETLVIP